MFVLEISGIFVIFVIFNKRIDEFMMEYDG